MSHLFGNSATVSRTTIQEVIDADDGTCLVVDAVPKKYELSVVSDVSTHLQNLLRCVQRGKEPFRLFGARLNAQLHIHNVLGSAAMLREPVSALLLLKDASADNAQSISILAASATWNACLTPRSSTDALIATLCYKTVASGRLCDVPESSLQHALTVVPAQTQDMEA